MKIMINGEAVKETHACPLLLAPHKHDKAKIALHGPAKIVPLHLLNHAKNSVLKPTWVG